MLRANLAPVEAILASQQRRQLNDGPTPVQRLRRLEQHLGTDVELWIKRDDLIRPMCGNKVRYLEFVLGAYDGARADCLIHCGGITSNYLAQIAMVCAAEGIPAHLIVLGERPETLQANVLVEEVFGANVQFRPGRFGTSCSQFKSQLAQKLKGDGRHPYVIDHPFSNFSAILGYMACYIELTGQVAEHDAPQPDHIFLCSAGNSYLGLRLADDLAGNGLAITTCPPLRWSESGLDAIAPDREAFLRKKADEFREFCGASFGDPEIDVDVSQVGDGYGQATAASITAVRLLASTEGILLDPIYTGKAMAVMLNRIRDGRFASGTRLLFLHTGGALNLFTYAKAFDAHAGSNH